MQVPRSFSASQLASARMAPPVVVVVRARGSSFGFPHASAASMPVDTAATASEVLMNPVMALSYGPAGKCFLGYPALRFM